MLLGALICARPFREEVCVWAVDREACSVIALDEQLFELASWVVFEPAKLSASGRAAIVSGAVDGEHGWWRLELGSCPARCDPPIAAPPLRPAPTLPHEALRGAPTAWASSGRGLLVATPGALHLFNERGELCSAQGGFRWVSEVVTTGSP